MSLTLPTSARNNQVDEFATLLDGGTIEFLDSAETTVLATCTFGSPAFAAASGGSAAANAITSGTAGASGSIAYARLKDSSGTICGQHITVTVVGGGGEIEIDAVAVTSGVTVVSVDSLTISQKAS